MATVQIKLADETADALAAQARAASFENAGAYLSAVVEELFATDDGQVGDTVRAAIATGDASPDSAKSPEEILDELMREP